MSHYTTVKTEFKSLKALMKALAEVGFTKEKVELHEEPVHLYGYQGDKRDQKAHVVIRRKYVGGASNDIGFIKEGKAFTAIVSEYDQYRYGPSWMKQLKRHYTKFVAVDQLKKIGCIVTENKNKQGQTILIGTMT